MILKTSVRRLEKWLPKSPGMMFAASVDELPAEPFESEIVAPVAADANGDDAE